MVLLAIFQFSLMLSLAALLVIGSAWVFDAVSKHFSTIKTQENYLQQQQNYYQKKPPVPQVTASEAKQQVSIKIIRLNNADQALTDVELSKAA